MTHRPRDPLLMAVRFITLAAIGLSALVGGAMVLASVAVLVARGRVLAELAGHGLTSAWAPQAIALILLLIAAMALSAVLFLNHLRRIVDSVGEGDPFQPANAGRLAAMGWLALAIEGLALPIGTLGALVADQVRDATQDFGIDFGGVLLALVLFVLARVFRVGARMRDDLEGTV